MAGGEFSLDYKSSGKYWISILDSDKLEDFEATSPELLSILEKRKVLSPHKTVSTSDSTRQLSNI